MSIPPLHPQLAALRPALVVFDKDGTLIDFHAMWAAWITELARRLETATGLQIAPRFFEVMGFNAASGQVAASGKLAVAPLAEARALTAAVLREAGLPASRAEAAVSTAWHLPDPVALANPLTDLTALFDALHRHGAKIAVATSDDTAPTEKQLAALGLAPLIDAIICADDDVPIKPAPDMILTLCRRLSIPPAKTVMVGDNRPDLQMGRAAGVGLTVGVLSGVGLAADLADNADVLLASVAGLLEQTPNHKF